jgi:hypothetical protein
MIASKRRAAAYIAGRLIAGRASNEVYDYSTKQHYRMYGDVSPGFVQVYDGDRYSYVSGSLTPNGLIIFDYYTRQHIRLRISGDDFYGYDFETGAAFDGIVKKSSVTFFDYEDSKEHRYAIKE